jgi:ribonuclease R
MKTPFDREAHRKFLDEIVTDHTWGTFPKKVLEHAQKLKLATLPHTERRDFTHIPTITIDPLQAKDFDDAISFSTVGGDLEIGVHIADVSYYVDEGGSD